MIDSVQVKIDMMHEKFVHRFLAIHALLLNSNEGRANSRIQVNRTIVRG